MNTIIQNILVVIAVALALWILYDKFLKPPSKKDKSCGKDGCGC